MRGMIVHTLHKLTSGEANSSYYGLALPTKRKSADMDLQGKTGMLETGNYIETSATSIFVQHIQGKCGLHLNATACILPAKRQVI